MIKILHTIDTTGPGGAETVFINLIKGLDSQRFKSFAAIRGPGWVCDTLRENGIKPTFVPAKGGFNLRYLQSLVRIIQQNKIDIIQSHLLGSNLYCSLAGLICGIPVISTFHGFVDASERERLMRLKSQIINIGSSKIVFVSDRLRSHYVSNYGFSSKKSITIYNGVNTDVFRPQKEDSIRKKLRLGPHHILIGSVGNIRPAKGYDVLLRAARIVCDKEPNCRFLVAGQGSGHLYESLLKLRRDLDLEKVFFFFGFCKDSAKVLNNLDIFVLPSVSEGFSISTIEAMACGIPVVVTRSGGPEEIVTNEINGITVDCIEGRMADGINYCINNNQAKHTIVNNALEEVSLKYCCYTMIEKYVNCYHGSLKDMNILVTDGNNRSV